MALSEEEKKKIYEEEKARKEAQDQLGEEEKKQKGKKTLFGCLGCFGLIVLIAVVMSMAGGSDDNKTQKGKDDFLQQQQQNQQENKERAEAMLLKLYEDVKLDMTEQQVIDMAEGDPDMVNEAEIAGFGKVKNLVYYARKGQPFPNLTISVQNGSVKVVVLGEMIDGQLKTKSKQ